MKTLKGRNLAWLVATVILDIFIVIVFAYSAFFDEMTTARIAATRVALTALLPIPVLLLSSLIPSDIKAVLVFWRWRLPLPGARAFSVHAPSDPRIDIGRLRKHVGEFPIEEREQNSKWYGLFRQVENDLSVVDSHKNYLLFRDIASLSILLTVLVPLTMHLIGGYGGTISAVVFFVQYLLAAVAARTNGVRLVQNVLAVHASRKVTGSRPAANRKSPKSEGATG